MTPVGMVPDDTALAVLAEGLGERLRTRGCRLATAESCTGGWIAKALTDIPGSSVWFPGGIVAYANEAKVALLGVEAALLAEHGAVSREVVEAMALGAASRCGAELACAVSGIAGPGGGTAEKPVGRVWFAWAGPDGVTSEAQQFGGDREAVRRQTVSRALAGLQVFMG